MAEQNKTTSPKKEKVTEEVKEGEYPTIGNTPEEDPGGTKPE